MDRLRKIIGLLIMYVEDLFIFIGLFLIIRATFILHAIAGMYVMGAIFVLIGYLISRKPLRPPRRR